MGNGGEINSSMINDVMAKDLTKDLLRCEKYAKDLKRLRFITNEIMSNCAYSNKNIETQFNKLNKLNVPDWEKQLIKDAWELKHLIGSLLIKDMKHLLKKYGIAINE